MKVRRILVASLLLFAAGSLAVSIWKHAAPRHGDDDFAVEPGEDVTIVGYMHSTFRCAGCNVVESAVEKMIASEFADDVTAGRVRLQAVDFLENPKLAARYSVQGPTVVVAKFKNGQNVGKWYKLDQALELAAEQPDKLNDYLRKGIREGVPEQNVPTMFWAALAAAFAAGLLTAVSPCPLATNVAAISFLGRTASRPRKVLLSGLAYTLGRTIVYVALGVVIVWALRQPWAGGEGGGGAGISRFLQTYGGMILGPALVVAGMVLLGLLTTARSLNLAGQGLQQKAAKGGVVWAFVLGVLFALSFCPISAMIFFGTMITLSAANQSFVLLPSAFGIATAVPVLVFAFLIAFASRYVGNAFNRMTQIDRWLRLGAGVIFIAAGVFYSLAHLGLISLGG